MTKPKESNLKNPAYFTPRSFGLRAGGSRSLHNKTQRRSYQGHHDYENGEKTIVLQFLEMLNTIKLYHWKTYSYATHKATDELHEKLSGHVDSFVEILLGKKGDRVHLTDVRTIPLYDFTTVDAFKERIQFYKTFLMNVERNSVFRDMANPDLLTIRDEMLGHLNQFLYLLTFTK